MATTLVQFRVDEELKNETARIYEELGLDLPTALRMFMKRSVNVNGIPFRMNCVNPPVHFSDASRLISQLQEQAEKSGASQMTLEEINAEIALSKKEREEKYSFSN